MAHGLLSTGQARLCSLHRMRRQSFPEVYNYCGRPHKGNTVLPARRGHSCFRDARLFTTICWCTPAFIQSASVYCRRDVPGTCITHESCDMMLSSLTPSGMPQAAIRDPDPVCILENELLYGMSFPVSEDALGQDYLLPIGKAKVMVEGTDVTLVAFSKMVCTPALGTSRTATAAKLSSEEPHGRPDSIPLLSVPVSVLTPLCSLMGSWPVHPSCFCAGRVLRGSCREVEGCWSQC